MGVAQEEHSWPGGHCKQPSIPFKEYNPEPHFVRVFLSRQENPSGQGMQYEDFPVEYVPFAQSYGIMIVWSGHMYPAGQSMHTFELGAEN
jgi:hypothetical protein